MKKNLLLCALVSLTFSLTATAQQITGSVSDDNGIPLPGASIVIEGTSDGTTTNFDGNFTIDASQGSTLVISYVGYESKEIVVGSSPINVQLISDNALDEVVVTALGLTREKKSLGYSVTEVDGDEINSLKDNNIASSLMGKVAGLNITQSGTIGSASRITLRGNNSVNGMNQALIVVDGIPINADGIESGQNADYSSTVIGGGITDINAYDIESISVLKGPNASALYGSRAGNGVILITTKTGSETEGLGISLNTNLTADTPMFLPDFQNEYAQGTLGAAYTDIATDFGSSSWGPKMGASQMYFDGTPRVSQAYPDNVKDFFNTGIKAITSISIQNASENGSVRFSYTNNDTQGMIPNSSMISHNFNLRGVMNLSDKLSIDAKATYFTQEVNGRQQMGGEGIMGVLYQMPRSVDINDLKKYQVDNPGTTDEFKVLNYGGSNSQTANPYWMANHDEYNERRNRFFGFAKINYEFTDWLSAFVRVGADVTDTKTKRITKTGHHNYRGGRMDLNTISSGELNTDLVFTAKKDITSDLNVVVNAGGSLSKRTYQGYYQFGENFKIPTKFFLNNAANILAPNETPLTIKKVNSAFASANFAYQDFLYVDLTSRNDWSSTLGEENRSYMYNSASVSAILNNFVDPEQKLFNLLKLRAGYAQVGNDTDPYQLYQTFDVPGQGYLGLTTLSAPSIKLNEDLKPEQVTSIEFGLEGSMLNNRLNFDISIYDKETTDMIFNVPVPAATGFQFFKENVGKVSNKGLEITLGGRIIQNSKMVWDSSLNYSKNENELLELIDDLETFTYMTTNDGQVALRAQVGGTIGDIYGSVWKTNESGQKLLREDGRPQTSDPDQYLGTAQPDFLAGWVNTFRYGNYTLSFQIDGRFGGQFYSNTSRNLDGAGVSERSLQYRESGVTLDGINSATGAPNTESITGQEYWGSLAVENYIYDQDNIRLRELSIGYQIPNTQSLGIQSASLQLVGRNLFFFSKDAPDVDPEMTLGTAIGAQGFNLNNLPSTRSLGLNLTLNF
ncbi:MAG: SusC/RagA family TonB-linked outer membrane protein [Flavobacteriaceae bacterium]|nr:SusC/RagA family TonB-linked outer membrane protein [Flavobacteriaceae bacterium]MBL6679013.1 SusC/RagA family TonB-linked outer membrane protein [Flavobacteriaceae bacterium]